MPNTLTNQDLRSAFSDQMEAAGTPIERVQGGHAANQLYRITAGAHADKTLRLRTNRNYVVMSLAEGPEHTAPISSLEGVDFAGVACVNHSGEVECYLIPAPRLIADMNAGHRAATEHMHRGPSGSRVRILFFGDRADRPWHGYGRKYAEFRLGPVERAPVYQRRQQGPRRGSDVIERAQRMVASEFGVPPSAVRISVDLVGAEPLHEEENRTTAH